MKRILSILALGLATACGGTGAPVEVSSAGNLGSSALDLPSVSPISDPGRDTNFAGLLNGVRMDNGVGDVTFNSRLNTAAQLHANDMLENNYLSHTGLNGSTVADRALAAGYDYRKVGENIASGYQDEASVLQGWVDSPSHHANNIDPEFEEFGLGVARDGNNTRWVLMLGVEK